MDKLEELLAQPRRVAAFTGAGISTLCGIPDFRGPKGLYAKPDAERIFDIDWFRRDPSLYYKGCAELVYGLERYIVLDSPDCELDATRAWRERIGRLVRDVAPDMS